MLLNSFIALSFNQVGLLTTRLKAYHTDHMSPHMAEGDYINYFSPGSWTGQPLVRHTQTSYQQCRSTRHNSAAQIYHITIYCSTSAGYWSKDNNFGVQNILFFTLHMLEQERIKHLFFYKIKIIVIVIVILQAQPQTLTCDSTHRSSLQKQMI